MQTSYGHCLPSANLDVFAGRELARSDGAALRGHRGPAALRLPAAPPRRQEGRPQQGQENRRRGRGPPLKRQMQGTASFICVVHIIMGGYVDPPL